jgi:hypothetical protein
MGTIHHNFRAMHYINGDSGQWCWSEMFLNLVFPYCTSEHLDKVWDTGMSLLHCSLSPHFLQRQLSPVGLSYHCLMQHSGSQYLHKFFSLSPVGLRHITKTNISLFLAEWPFKLVHTASLSTTGRTTAISGNLSPLQQLKIQIFIHLCKRKNYSTIP